MEYTLTCAISKMPIRKGEECYIIPIVKTNKNWYKGNKYIRNYYDTGYMNICGLIRCKYKGGYEFKNLEETINKQLLDRYIGLDSEEYFNNLSKINKLGIKNVIFKDSYIEEDIYRKGSVENILINIFKNQGQELGDSSYKIIVNNYTELIYNQALMEIIVKNPIKDNEVVDIVEVSNTLQVVNDIYKKTGYLLGIKEDYVNQLENALSLNYIVIKKSIKRLVDNVYSYGNGIEINVKNRLKEFQEDITYLVSERVKAIQHQYPYEGKPVYEYLKGTKLDDTELHKIMCSIEQTYKVTELFNKGKIQIEPTIVTLEEEVYGVSYFEDLTKIMQEEIFKYKDID